MDILKRGTHYPGVLTGSQLNEVSRYYKGLLGANTSREREIKENFTEHIKNSIIKISESELIQLYISIFSNKDVTFLYDAFNMKKEETCLDVNTQALSIITLSKKQLMLINLGFQEILHMCSLFSTYKNFPSFQPLAQDEEIIQITIESNPLSEKKVVLLFNLLVQSNYCFQADCQQEFKNLFDLMAKINERIDLDYTMTHSQKIKEGQKDSWEHKKIKI